MSFRLFSSSNDRLVSHLQAGPGSTAKQQKGGNDPVRSQLTVRTRKHRAGRSRPFADDHRF